MTAGRIFFRSLFPYDLIGLTMFQKLIEFVLKSKFIVLSVIVGLVLWGSFSLQNLPIDAVPDITNNQVVLITQSPTLATQEVEKYVTAPIELQLANISGVEQIRSISRQGLSVITLIFKEEVPAYQARQVVTEQLKVVERDIPQGFVCEPRRRVLHAARSGQAPQARRRIAPGGQQLPQVPTHHRSQSRPLHHPGGSGRLSPVPGQTPGRGAYLQP